jgi:hypothetical protein
MPPEARAELLAHVDKQVANMPAEVRAEVLGARKPRPARKKSAPIESADMGEELDLEKAWHGIHFLLCGSAGESPETLGTAVLGGKELGADLGYGPARYLEAADVKEIASALKRVTAEELGARFNAAALDEAKVYPGGWGADEDRREWLLEGFAELRSFCESAAENGFGVLLYIV